MSMQIQPPETDLIMPLPAEGETWDAHTIHTHYFGFCVPEANIGAFLYVRYQPSFPLSQGGVAIFRGMDNVALLDAEFLDYEMTMPWPSIDGNVIETANGLRIEFLELGKSARITYTSPDGETTVDVTANAVTPLLRRGHVMPGEEKHHDPGSTAGGSEQFMHMTGELVLRGERFEVDCHYARDRSWRQVRVERQNAVRVPPIGWTPMYFGDDLIFNQVGFEPADTDPAWTGLYELPAGAPSHHFAWAVVDGEPLEIVRVRRNVLERHPTNYMATRQEVEAEDENGRVYHFRGEAIASAVLPAWPNVSFHDSVYRWESEDGRVAHCTYQEIWFDDYERAMSERARAVTSA